MTSPHELNAKDTRRLQEFARKMVHEDVRANANWFLEAAPKYMHDSEWPDFMPCTQGEAEEAWDSLRYVEVALTKRLLRGVDLDGLEEIDENTDQLTPDKARELAEAIDDAGTDNSSKEGELREAITELELERSAALTDHMAGELDPDDARAIVARCEHKMKRLTALADAYEKLADEQDDYARELKDSADDPYEHEAFECWIVTDWLMRRLRERDEVVVDCGYSGNFWLRCTTGQAIYADGVIERIALELMLERDKYKGETMADKLAASVKELVNCAEPHRDRKEIKTARATLKQYEQDKERDA